MENINDIWGNVTKQLRDEMSTVAFDTWIKPIKPVEVAGGFYYALRTRRAAKRKPEQKYDNDKIPLAYREQYKKCDR